MVFKLKIYTIKLISLNSFRISLIPVEYTSFIFELYKYILNVKLLVQKNIKTLNKIISEKAEPNVRVITPNKKLLSIKTIHNFN